MMRFICAALAAALAAATGQAADKDPCAIGMVCASAPQTIAKALQDAGYKANFGMDDSGDPMIDSVASDINFTIFFYDCESGSQCGSIQFVASFDAEDSNTPELANRWNNKKRFTQVSVNDNKVLNVRYDVTTVGGLNQKNFKDVLLWWEAMLGDLRPFFQEHPGGE